MNKFIEIWCNGVHTNSAERWYELFGRENTTSPLYDEDDGGSNFFTSNDKTDHQLACVPSLIFSIYIGMSDSDDHFYHNLQTINNLQRTLISWRPENPHQRTRAIDRGRGAERGIFVDHSWRLQSRPKPTGCIPRHHRRLAFRHAFVIETYPSFLIFVTGTSQSLAHQGVHGSMTSRRISREPPPTHLRHPRPTSTRKTSPFWCA